MNEIAKIKRTFKELGIHPDLKGYHYAVKAVMLIKSDFDNGKAPRPFVKLYKEVAEKFETSSIGVERCIRHSIEIAEEKNTDAFKYLFGNINNVTVSIFICVVAEHIADPY